jgi:primosomal protein N' (replication factor Y)
VGRGGRGSKPGRAVLQTMMPEHYIIRLAAAQVYRSFYDKEIASRRLLVYPPLCDMCIIGLVGEEEDAVFEAVKLLKAYAEERAAALDRKKVPVQVIGPGSFVYTKVNNKYRYRIIIKCKNTAPLREYIRDILVQGTKRREFSKITVYADMNGSID